MSRNSPSQTPREITGAHGISPRAENSYSVGTADELTRALEEIGKSSSDEAIIVLTGDFQATKRTAVTDEEKALVAGTDFEKATISGVVGKHLTFTSEQQERHSISDLGSYLVGDITFDNVTWSTSADVYANGFTLEFTENFGGSCSGYVYGGSDRRAVDSTHLIFNGGSFGNGSTSYGIYGGGYAGGMGRPTGPSLGLDGNPGMPGWTPPEFKAGTGDVEGDVRVEIGGTATLTYLIGGSRNGNVKGDVYITLKSDTADTRTVGWIAGAGYGNQKGYGNVMGNVKIDALSGNVAYITGTGNQGATGSPGIELGDVDSVAGDVTITVGQDSGTPMYIRQSGGGTNLLAGCGKPMTISAGGVAVCGDVNIVLNKTAHLDDGDAANTYYGTVFGVHSNSVVYGSVNIVNNGAAAVRDLIGTADGAKIMGNGREYALSITMNDGDLRTGPQSNAGRGYIRPYKSAYGGGAETLIKNDVIFEVNGGTLWGAEATEKSQGTFTIDGDFSAIIRTTTKNGLVTAVGGKVGSELTDGHTSTAVFTGGGNILIDNVVDFDHVVVQDNTIARLRAVNDEDGGAEPYPFAKDDGVPAVKDVTIEEGSVLALYKEGEITGDLTVDGTLALARKTSGVVAPMRAGGTASGTGSLRPISTSTSLFIKSAPKLLEEYVYAQKADSDMELALDSSNNNTYFVDRKASAEADRDVWFINETPIPQDVTVTFDANGGDVAANPSTMTVTSGASVGTLPAEPERRGYRFLGWNTQKDGKGDEFTAATPVTADITVYAQWEQLQPQDWYYQVYYQSFTPTGSEIDESGATYVWKKWKFGNHGGYYPGDAVSISADEFNGKQLSWDANDGSGKETLGIHYVFDEDYGPHRLSALCEEATSDNPLKIYYRAAPHTVSYEYDGAVPEGAPELPAAVATAYGATVEVSGEPSMAGWRFSGWTVKSPASASIVDGKLTVPNSDVVLTGSWTKLAEPVVPQSAAYAVEHYLQQPDGSYKLAHTEFPLYGKIGAEVEAQVKGYEGHHLNSDKSALKGKVFMPYEDGGKPICLVLRAYYDIDIVTLRYDLAGGTGAEGADYSQRDLPFGTEVTAEVAPTRDGYRFAGWSDGVATLDPGAVFELVGDTTLTALWEKKVGPVDPEQPGPGPERPDPEVPERPNPENPEPGPGPDPEGPKPDDEGGNPGQPDPGPEKPNTDEPLPAPGGDDGNDGGNGALDDSKPNGDSDGDQTPSGSDEGQPDGPESSAESDKGSGKAPTLPETGDFGIAAASASAALASACLGLGFSSRRDKR